MNPIFIQYYSHEGCDCYKINLPWTKYARETMVLCPVSEGYESAKRIAQAVIVKHFLIVTQQETKPVAEGEA